MSSVFLIVNVAGLIALLISIGLASRRPADRGFIPGLLLIGVGVVGFTLHELHIFPREWSSIARFPFLGIAIMGLVLLERERVRKSKSSFGDRPSCEEAGPTG
jgi:uncharacterized membrane protein YhaH (DUF805 family)